MTISFIAAEQSLSGSPMHARTLATMFFSFSPCHVYHTCLCCEWTFKSKHALLHTCLCCEWTFEIVNMPWFRYVCVVNEHLKQKLYSTTLYITVPWMNVRKSKHTLVHTYLCNEWTFKSKHALVHTCLCCERTFERVNTPWLYMPVL